MSKAVPTGKKACRSDVKLPSEHVEQREFVSWFRKTWPGVRIFAIPNGGLRNKAVAQKLKAEGVSPGVPDLYIPAWKLWIEMKRQKGGRLSEDQKDWAEYLEGVGDTVIVGYGWLDAIDKVNCFLDSYKNIQLPASKFR